MKGIALVIGIDNYTHVDDYPKLNSAGHDEEIAKALTLL